MSFPKATQKSVPIGTSASNAHPTIGRGRSDTDRQLPPSFDTASAFMRSRAETNRHVEAKSCAEEKREKEEWESPSDWNIESSHYGDEWDEQYPPEEIVADPSVVDDSDDASVFDLPPPSPSPPLTRQNAVCFVCCEVPGSYKTNGMCDDCYNNPPCLHCGMKCDTKDDSLCKEHSHLTMTDLYYGTCGPCKTNECPQNGYTQLCGYCLNCAAYEQNLLPWTPIMSIDPEFQTQAPKEFYCETCGSDLYLGYCPDEHCQNTCPECLEDNDGHGNNRLCNSCHGYDPEEDLYTNEYEASMVHDDRCQLFDL